MTNTRRNTTASLDGVDHFRHVEEFATRRAGLLQSAPSVGICQGRLDSSVRPTAIRSNSTFPTPQGLQADGRTIVVVDTPNIFRSTQKVYGEGCLPDYSELLSIAQVHGSLISAFALVNDGYPKHLTMALERTGYTVLQSEGRDCDYRFVEQTVAVYKRADVFMLCSGDHRFSTVTCLLRDVGKRVIVCALKTSCSRHLIANADEFVPFPVRQKETARASKRQYACFHHDLQRWSIDTGFDCSQRRIVRGRFYFANLNDTLLLEA